MPTDFDNSGDFKGGQLNQASPINTQINNFGGQLGTPDAAFQQEAKALFDKLPVDAVPTPAPCPGASNIPFPPNPTFVGRDDELLRLAAIIKEGGATAVCQSAAATGMGGIGKTQLASEFCHRYGQHFKGGVFWLNFDSDSDVGAEVAACGVMLGLGELTAPEQRQGVLGHWQSEVPCLIVFDNCEDEALFQEWRPTSGAGRVLVTSLSASWSATGGVEPVALDVLTPQASVELLRKHRSDLSVDSEALSDIAEELGHLPLALHLAGNYLEQNHFDEDGEPEVYLARLRESDLLSDLSLTEGRDSPTKHDQSVVRTFILSVDQLDAEDSTDALAKTLLFRAACFAPGEPIPRDLLKATVVENPKTSLKRVIDLGLVSEATDTNGAITVHRLVHMAIRSLVSDLSAHREVVEQVALEKASEVNGGGLPARLTSWRPHLEYIVEQAEQRKSKRASKLLSNLGYHLNEIADFDGAQVALERALEIDEAAHGLDHPAVAIHLNNLGYALKESGDLDGAQAAYERAIKIDEATYGSDHPSVATRVNNLGSVLYARGNLDGAQAAFERALKIDETTYGPDHPNVSNYVSNLGQVLVQRPDLDEAQAAFERALKIDEATYGPDHPNVAIRVNNLGGVLRAHGDLDAAQAMYERALKIDEAAFGLDHPKVAIRVNNLGGVLESRGDLDGARAKYKCALKICEAALGPDHADTVIFANNLKRVLKNRDDFLSPKKKNSWWSRLLP